MRIEALESRELDDRRRVLNALAGLTTKEPPPYKHDNYVKVNKRMNALFGLVFWRRVISGPSSDTDLQRVQNMLADALRADEWRNSLSLSTAFMTGGPDEK